MKFARTSITTAIVISMLAATGCTTVSVLDSRQTITNGFVADEQTLALAPVGSSRDQVLLSLGSPSATATFDNEVFYYISQKRERPVAFMKPRVVSQSVLAVYFDKDGTVAKLANYTLQDGKPFDMISRTTPTGGREMSFLQRMLSGGAAGAAATAQSLFGNNSY